MLPESLGRDDNVGRISKISSSIYQLALVLKNYVACTKLPPVASLFRLNHQSHGTDYGNLIPQPACCRQFRRPALAGLCWSISAKIHEQILSFSRSFSRLQTSTTTSKTVNCTRNPKNFPLTAKQTRILEHPLMEL